MGRNVNPRPQFFDSAGDPLISGKMYYFESGTDTPKATFADVNMTIQNTHPVILTGDGRLPNVFLSGTTRMKLTDADDVQLWDIDPTGGDDIGGNFEQWVPSVVYNANDIVQGSDGSFYLSFTNGNLGNDPTSTPTEWQEIQFINVWNTNVTYQIGDTVKGSDNLFYVSQTADNQGNDPTSDAVNWGPPFDAVVSITGGTGITVSGTSSIPIVTADNNGTVTSVTGGTGITIGGTAADPIVNADNDGTVTSVATAGLATGGPITATGTVTVTKASAGEVATGTDDTKAVTPLAMADALLGANDLSDVNDTQTSLNTLTASNFVGSNKGTDIASGATIVIPTDGDYFDLTGAVTVADMTVATNRRFTLKAIAGLTFTASATIVTFDGNDLVLTAGQTVTLQSTATDVVQVVSVGAVIVGINLGTPVALTSGTSIDFPSIPAGTKRITIMVVGMSTTGVSNHWLQLGDSGGVEATGYAGACGISSTNSNATTNQTSAFQLFNSPAAAGLWSGSIILTLENAASFTWTCQAVVAKTNDTQITMIAGSKSLSAELDRVRLTTAGGSDTFDAGEANILFEG